MDIEKGVTVVLDKWYHKMAKHLVDNGYPTEQTVELDGDKYTFQFSTYRYRSFSFTVNDTKSYTSNGNNMPPKILTKLKRLLTAAEDQIKGISSTLDTLDARELLASATDMIGNPTNIGYSEIEIEGGAVIGLIKEGSSMLYYKKEPGNSRVDVEAYWPRQAVVSGAIPRAVIKDFNKLKTHVLKLVNWKCTTDNIVEATKSEIRKVLLTTPKKDTISALLGGESLSYKGNSLEISEREFVKKSYSYASPTVHDRIFFVTREEEVVDWIKAQKKVSRTRTPSIYSRAQAKEAKAMLAKAFKALDLHKIGYDTRSTTIAFSIDALKVQIGSTKQFYTQLRTDNAYFMVDGVKLGWPIRNNGTEMFMSTKHPSNQKLLDNFDAIMSKATELVDNYEEVTLKHNEEIESQLKEDFKGDLLAAMLDQDI